MPTSSRTHNCFVEGLSAIYRQEASSLITLSSQTDRLENYAELHRQISDHLAKTRDQIRRLEAIYEEIGVRPGTEYGAMFASPAPTFDQIDPAAKDTLFCSFENYAREHYEIICYRALIRKAEIVDCKFAIPLLEQSLAEEEQMALWLEDHAGLLIDRYLAACVHKQRSATM